jgi:hypothetical protein
MRSGDRQCGGRLLVHHVEGRTVPLPVPGKLFWSVTVYDVQTRSQIQTKQNKAALRSLFELTGLTGDTAHLHFGPTPPTQHDDRWIQTIPGEAWFVYFRIYGPQQAAFDKTWRPGDFEVLTDHAS